MYGFIARQPIFNPDMNTVAYELLFRDGMANRFPDVSAEYPTSRMISDHFLSASAYRRDTDLVYQLSIQNGHRPQR